MLVGSIIINDQVEVEFGRRFGVDLLEKPNELLLPMPWQAVADHLPIEHAERRKERRRAVAMIVVSERPASPSSTATRAAYVECLDL
jgi:hypothetical protein